MVNSVNYSTVKVDIDFNFYMANVEAIDTLAQKTGKHWFVGREIIAEGKEVAVFLFPSAVDSNRIANFVDAVAELV